MRFPLPILILGCIYLCLPMLTKGQGNSSFCANTALVPVFKQDFGQSPSATASSTAPAGSTNYNFGNVGTDGNYIVTSRVENANKSDWTKGRDHTGNTHGNFFLVNAGGNRNIFLQQTVTGLCPGSSYSFTAWLANVNTPLTNSICGNNPVYPRITFKILDLSDNLLATYTTNNLPLSPNAGPVNWQKYGFQFSLPVNTTALKIQMVDFWGGGPACGNDVALDDILFEACVPKISVSLSGGDNVCIGKDINLESSLVNSPYTAPAYLWQKSNNNGNTWDTLGTPGLGFNQFPILNAQLKDSGWYRVLVAPTATNILNVTCGAISNTVKLVVNPLPVLQLQSNAPICSGSALTLSVLATGGSGTYTQFVWQGPNGFSDSTANLARPKAPTAFSGTYWAQVLDSKGCTDTANISVQIDSTPVLQWVNLTDSICSKSNVSAAVQASLPQSNISWTAVNPHGIQLTGNFTTSNNHQFLGSAQHAQNQSLNWQLKALATTSQGCNSSLLDSTIVVHALPSPALAGPDQIICANNTVLQAQLPATGTGSWQWISPTDSSVHNGQKFSTIAPALNNNFIPQSSINFSQLGHYALQWLVSTPFCGTHADTVLITRIPTPQPILNVADSAQCGPASFSFFNKSPLAKHYGFIWQLG
ncbi:MAG: hypothetical protein EAZ62_02245, partial [Sphingobacteriia bacterium]